MAGIPGLTINTRGSAPLPQSGNISFKGGAPLQISGSQIAPAPRAQVLGASTVRSSGGGGGSPVAAPQASGGGAPQIPQPQQSGVDFNALIQPALDALDQAIGPLQQSEASQETGINQNKQTAIDSTNQSIGAQTNTINQAQTQQTKNEQTASDAARRQYSEIQQGLQARYGGTTGTGAFATEQAGTQTLRSLSDIKTAASNAQAQLSDKLQQVQEVGRTALQDIANQAQQQISQAQNNLQLQLADIRNQKGQLLAHKAELAANAMQQYQATVNQVNTANAQFAQQLYSQQQAAQQSLQSAISRASAVTSSATPQDLGSLVAGINQPGYTASGTQKIAGGGSISLKQNPSTANDASSILQQLGLQ